MSQIGYLVCSEDKINEYKDWKYEFSNQNGYYYSNPEVRNLDEEFGDVFARISDI